MGEVGGDQNKCQFEALYECHQKYFLIFLDALLEVQLAKQRKSVILECLESNVILHAMSRQQQLVLKYLK